jgi:hypothetical protein
MSFPPTTGLASIHRSPVVVVVEVALMGCFWL